MFFDEVHDYQQFIMNNFPLLGNQYEIVQEQFHVKNAFIDILAYNKQNECLTIIELKNPIAYTKAVSQIIKYYYYIKDMKLDTYNIINVPECFIIAPRFNSKIILPEIPIIHLFKMDQQYSEFIDITNEYMHNSVLHSNIKKKPTAIVTNKDKLLIKQLIYHIQKFYDNKLVITEKDNQTIIFYDKRIIIKITIPLGWFNDNIELVITDRFIKPYTYQQFRYDPAIRKIKEYKTMIKLLINDIPQFLKEK